MPHEGSALDRRPSPSSWSSVPASASVSGSGVRFGGVQVSHAESVAVFTAPVLRATLPADAWRIARLGALLPGFEGAGAQPALSPPPPPVSPLPSYAAPPPLQRGDGHRERGAPGMDRRARARGVRRAAADVAFHRPHAAQTPDGEEQRHRFGPASALRAGAPSYLTRFTKGLPHDERGLLRDPRDHDDLARACTGGDAVALRRVRLGPRAERDADRDADVGPSPPPAPRWRTGADVPVRKLVDPLAGHAFDLEGPDPQSLAQPPPPELDSDELVAEVAELYAMALLRDVPFARLATDPQAERLRAMLARLPWLDGSPRADLAPAEAQRRRTLAGAAPGELFRGLTPGDRTGPWLSQLLVAGAAPLGERGASPEGRGSFGALRLDRRVRVAEPGRDHGTSWTYWLDLQDGAAFAGDRFVGSGRGAAYRTIATPRDLATYVHFDQLYQAYLAAGLLLLELGAPLDRGLPLRDEPVQHGFASFGAPHLLALLAEVSTRALKAVFFQKWSVHRRARPEALGGLVELYDRGYRDDGLDGAARLHGELERIGLLDLVRRHNRGQNAGKRLPEGDRPDSLLLPLAYPEGSPMHPAYGAGHATVAGACTTVLKAWFDGDHPLGFAYEPRAEGDGLADLGDLGLTVGGELDKLAANVSVGRNLAGVHYFTDYWESIRLGEAVALALLEEQRLAWGEAFGLSLRRFAPARGPVRGTPAASVH